MQQTSRHFAFLLPLIIAGSIIMLSLALSNIAWAQSSQQVTVGVGETTLTINGQTSPGTFVTVLKNNTPIGSASADGSGEFSLTMNFESGGINQLSIFGTTPDGAATDPLIASINVVQQQNTVFYAFLPPSTSLESSQVMAGQSVRAFGETMPNGTVVVTTDTGLVSQATADSAGKWEVAFSAPSPGLHSLFAVAHDGFGQQSAPTRNLLFMVKSNEVAPTPPFPISPIRPIPKPTPSTPIITSPQNNQYLNTRTVVVKGSADKDNLIEVWIGNKIVGSAYASENGTWQLSFSATTPHTVLRSRACLNGVCSDFSPTVNIYLSTSLLRGTLFTLLDVPEYNFTLPIGEQLALPLLIDKGKPPYDVTVDWGDNMTDSKTYPAAGRYTLVHTYETPGLYSGFVTVEDSNKVKDVHYFAVRVTRPSSPRIDTPLEWLMLGVVGLLTIQVLVSCASMLRRRG